MLTGDYIWKAWSRETERAICLLLQSRSVPSFLHIIIVVLIPVIIMVIIIVIMVTTYHDIGRAEVVSEETYPDPGDVYMREPFVVHFKVHITYQFQEVKICNPRYEGCRTWRSWSCLVYTLSQPLLSSRLMLLLML